VKGDRLLPQHHVARHCRKGDLFWLGITPTAILESALDPDADGVSVTWLEHFGGDRQHQIAEARRHMTLRITPRQSNRVAILNVGNVEYAAGSAAGVHVIEDPIDDPPPNPAHALIKEPTALQSQNIRAAIASTVQPSDIETY